MSIVCLGSMNLDYIYAVPHLVRDGETLPANALSACPGGKGLNQSLAAARSGAAVFHAGMLGSGGEPLRACLAESGVDVSLLRPCAAPQGHTVIQVDSQGQNGILVFGGSNRQVTPAYIGEALSLFRPGDYLLVQNEISHLEEALAAARRLGLRIVLNASPISEALLRLDLSGLEWLVVNELECAAVAGCQDPLRGYDLLRRRYPETGLLLTLGRRGSVSWKEGREVSQSAYPAQAVDTTGAGDTFAGYFVGSLSQGRSREEAMALAAMAAAIAVSKPGAAPSIPRLEEVLAALEQRP